MKHGWRTYDMWKKFLLNVAFTAGQFFISFLWPTYLNCEEHVCICKYLIASRLYMYYSYYQITLQWNIFTQIGSGSKFWPDIYHLGHRRGGGSWTNTVTIPAVNCWPKCPDEIWTSEHPLHSTNGSCVVFVRTTERFALDLSAHNLSLFFRVRTVNTFWQTSVEGSNKCLHIEIQIVEAVNKYLLTSQGESFSS